MFAKLEELWEPQMLADSGLPSNALWLYWAGDGHILHSAVVVSLQYRVSWSFSFDALTGELERTLEPACCVLRVSWSGTEMQHLGIPMLRKSGIWQAKLSTWANWMRPSFIPSSVLPSLQGMWKPFLWSGSVLHLPWKLFHVHLLNLQKLNFLLFGFLECLKTFLEGSRSSRQTLSISSAYFQLLPLVSLLPAHVACHFPGAFLEFRFVLPGLVTYPTHASDYTLHCPALLFLLPSCSNTGFMGRIGKNSECLNTEWTLSNYTGFFF